MELVRVASIDHVGEPVGQTHLSLEGLTDLVFEDLPAAEAAQGVDVVLLGLPHKVSAAKAVEIMSSSGIQSTSMPSMSARPSPPAASLVVRLERASSVFAAFVWVMTTSGLAAVYSASSSSV